jgi:endonuclease YncB( thermonuclease family)
MLCCFKPDIENAPPFTLNGVQLECKVVDVYDGDTITIIFPFYGNYYKDKCRLFGIDTPEVRTKNLEEKAAGLNAKEWLKQKILYKTVIIDFKGKGKYGRLMGDVYEKNNNVSINTELIQKGMAYSYDGGKKKAYGSW